MSVAHAAAAIRRALDESRRQVVCQNCLGVTSAIVEAELAELTTDYGRRWLCDECIAEFREDPRISVSLTGAIRGRP